MPDAHARLGQIRMRLLALNSEPMSTIEATLIAAVGELIDVVEEQKVPRIERALDLERRGLDLMRDPRYWRDRDPELIAEVTNIFRQLYQPDA